MSKVSIITFAFIGRAAMAVLALLFLATSAFAHASLIATEPRDGAVVATAPSKFILSFSEPVSPLALRLVEPDGSPVELKRFVLRDRTVEIEVPPALSSGTHVLSWRVVSEDGHPVGGSMIFSIGAASSSSPVAESIDWKVRAATWSSRIAIYVGLFFGIGGVFAANWLLRDASVARQFNVAMLVIGFLGTGVSAGLQGLDALGKPISAFYEPSVWVTGLATSFGRTVIAMSVALVLGVLALQPRLTPARVVSLVAILTGSLALSLSGHASAAEPQWIMRPSVFLHALTIALWVGALGPLSNVLKGGHPTGVQVLHRFSVLAPSVVAVLVAAGLALAVVQVEKPSALLGTAYGNVLIIKLALVLLLFALAAFNRWVLTARTEAGDKRAPGTLVRLVAVEALVVLMIFGVAAAWRFTPPPRALDIASAQLASIHLHGNKVMAEVAITPSKAGSVEASAFIMDAEFSPLDAKEVTFVLSNPSAGVDQIKRKASRQSDGAWRAADFVLPLPGSWRIRLDVLISDFDIERIEGEIQIKR